MEDILGVALTKKQCFICMKIYDGDIVMNTKLTKPLAKKVKEMHGKVTEIMDKPCDECAGHMKKGIVIVSVQEGSDRNNPHRTGGFWVVTDDYIKRILSDEQGMTEMREAVLKTRMLFMEHEACEKMGLFEQQTQ